MNSVKKVAQRIYNFNLKDCLLEDGKELIVTTKGNEFINTFKHRDVDKGIIVMPSGYKKGLVYKSTNGGEIYNVPSWLPDIVSFIFNLYGLKQGAFYRITVRGRNTHKFNRISDMTDDRKLDVITDQNDCVLSADFSEVFTNTEFSGLFRANSTEMNLIFTLGKIFINDIVIDEVELVSDEKEEIEEIDERETIEDFENKIISYSVFSPELMKNNTYKGKYAEISKIAGKGLRMFFDRNSNHYTLERDNADDTIGASFLGLNYLVDFNFNKAVNVDYFDRYEIVNVSPEMSPNTLKQGYIELRFIKDGKPVEFSNPEARIAVVIRKVY